MILFAIIILEKMRKKIKKLIILFVVAICAESITVIADDFKDISQEVKKASDELSVEGLFNFFIYKYGQNTFRPDANVNRSDLILVLNEYYALTNKFIERDVEIISKINELRTEISSNKYIDTIFQKFQVLLEPMLKNSATIKKLIQQNIAPLRNEIKVLKSTLEDLSEKINEIIPPSAAIKEMEISKSTESLTEDIIERDKESVTGLARFYFYLLGNTISALNKKIDEFNVDEINKEHEKRFEEKIKVISEEFEKESKSELNKLKEDIEKLEKAISILQKDINKITQKHPVEQKSIKDEE